ncbi:MAG: hypothetical protein D8M59_03850 [Planctomycetes bacterium]|nr:hypothetical protein [Planctomycetota bacterium]NOG53129.1 hypothetical protein [Planctomycetota bacterium]
MKKNDITIGSVYTAKITNRVVPVRIDAENPHGGWDATNLTTKKKVRIKSAAKLRGEYQEGAKAKDAPRATTAAPDAKGKAKASGKATTSKATPTATTPQRGGKAQKGKTGKAPQKKKRTGILDAAATILSASKEPMGCKAIVEQAIEKGLWSTTGKTPSATLYAAIIREIAKRGKDARFVKTDRGLFTAVRKVG